MKNKIVLTLVFIAIAIIATSCFAGGNPSEGVVDEFGNTAGFLRGLWHGFIAPFTFFVSLFTDIHFYEVHNNGGWYNFGFVIGAGIIFSGGGRASRRKRKTA